MENILVAVVAVASARYHIDKPFDYRVPGELRDTVTRGLRVVVPFGRGNVKTEAIILSLKEEESARPIKTIIEALEEAPNITEEQLKLAVWMSERFFCTVYDAVRACLPSGLWYREGKAPMTGKVAINVSLNVTKEEATAQYESRKSRAPTQAAILKMLADSDGPIEQGELLYQTGATAAVLRPLEKQELITLEKRVVYRRPSIAEAEYSGEPPSALTEPQDAAYLSLKKLLDSEKAEAALLYGVTGSGKTNVYMRLIDDVLASGQTAIALVPEIALTPQLMGAFAARFGEEVAVLHSGLTPAERFDEWRRIRAGVVRVVVGTRSAVFAPLNNIGLIVIDEEQERTYKSEASPRYHAREIAKYRCAKANALLVLGSATPSIESMRKAEDGVYRLVRLDSRFNERPLPRVIISDMKEELRTGRGGPIGTDLERELRINMERGEQSILFINRRGANPIVTCVECRHTFGCSKCSVSMTYHSANGRLMCHYCGYSEATPEHCPTCGGKLKFTGAGTQKVEETLNELFPGSEVLRMDADTVSAANPHERILSDFREKKAPILLGTQMVAKGLDFENVTLVGVILADMTLYVNDYRAHERTFSLITQVVGRSGRGDKEGRAVIQTMTPENDVIMLASQQDYDNFYRREIWRRMSAGLPPARDLISVNLSGENETAVIENCGLMRAELERAFAHDASVMLLGPAPAPVARVNNKYRYRLSLLCANTKELRGTVARIVRSFAHDKRSRGVTAFTDVDPFE